MAVLPETITEGGKYITEENSLGHCQIKEVLKIHRDKQDSQRDIIEYRSKTSNSTAPWVMHRCTRGTFAKSVIDDVCKMAS